MSEFQRLVFQDILPPEILDQLGNLSDLGDDESYMNDEDSKKSNQQNGKHSGRNVRGRGRPKAKSRSREESEQEDNDKQKNKNSDVDDEDSDIDQRQNRRDSKVEDEDEDRFRDDFSIDIEEDQDEESKRDQMDSQNNDPHSMSNQIDNQSDYNSQSQLLHTPNSARKLKKGKVQFSDSLIDQQNRRGHASNNATNKYDQTYSTRNYQRVDLSVLYKTKNEIVYKLTELYLPTTKNQRVKMYEYNREKMTTPNDIENEVVRTRKRKLKEEIKQAQIKLKHQMKYCNPAPLLEDVLHLYTPAITSKQLDQMRESRNKYSNAPHIGRILPQKRHMTSLQITDQQRNLQQQSLDHKQQDQESQLKSYILEDNYGLKDVSIQQELEQQMTQEETQIVDKEYKQLEQAYFLVSQKMNEKELSLTDLTQEERLVIKKYLKQQVKVVVESKYPTIQLNRIERHCFNFMKHFNAENYSFKGQKSAIQSDESGMFMEDILPGLNQIANNNTANSISHNLFGVTSNFSGNNNTQEDKLSQISDGTYGRNKDFQDFNHKDPSANLPSEYQIQEWITEQNFKQINIQQQQLSIYPTTPQKATHGSRNRQGKEERIFKIEKYNPPLPGHHKGSKRHIDQGANPGSIEKDGVAGLGQVAIVGSESYLIKDIKEYEYFKNQEKMFFAEETNKKISLNSIMRSIHLELGMISEQEFYAQEELEEQLQQQQQQSIQSSTAVGYPQKQYSRGQQMTKHQLSIQSQQQLTYTLSTSQAQQQRKEQVLNEFVDNFDMHFESRKKELHEVMLKKIQQHEKATQQTSGTGQQQTVAYASGSHALLQATAGGNESNKGGLSVEANRDKIKNMVNMIKMREDQEMSGMGRHDENVQDEEMLGDEAIGPTGGLNPHKPENHGMMGDESMRLRVTKSRASELNHGKCILKLIYTKFEWSEKALMNFHRPNISDVFEQEHYERERDRDHIHKQQMALMHQQMDSMQMDKQNPLFITIAMKVLSADQIEKRKKKTGIINAHEFFRDRYKLSLKDGKFCVFEHIDQQPLFVNNFGMASKLKRYLYSDKFLPDSAFLKRRENQGTKHMGPHGVQILKKKGEKIPLLGQIDTKYLKGITVMENNMYYCPVFYHKPSRNDFLCVVHRDKQHNPTIVVRELSELYVMGQEEPKIEVYNPQSRQYQHFIKRRTQAYVIRFLQENGNNISFQELNKYFLYINDQILKKIIKEINVEVDRNQFCSLAQEYNDEQFRQLITPENICQYESAQFGEQMLKKVGIRDITNADKISFATNKFCSEEPNQKKQLIARIIEEEVLSTPWNLSQSFIHNKQTRGMMMMEGTGDPSHGHGGYSYIKLPLKISQDSLNKAKINRMYLNPAIQNPKAVTGTDADLRKLSKKEIKNKLIDLGFKEESISSFTRWEMVALLRDKSSQAVSQGAEGEMKKFARGVRFTSKKQREMYQKYVNDIFKKQMSYLSKESSDFIQDYSDTETRDQRQKKLTDIQQANNNYSKNIVELKEDIEIKNIRDIPNFEILIMANQAIGPASSTGVSGSLNIGSNSISGALSMMQSGYDPNTGILDREAATQALRQRLNEGMTLKCTILRKKIKPVNSTMKEEQPDKIERVLFCSDPKQIKNFNKRKHKHEVKIKRTKKTSLKDKMQTLKPIMDDKDRRGDGRSETSSMLRGGQSAMNKSINGPNSMRSSGGAHHSGGIIGVGDKLKINLGHLKGNVLSDPNKFAQMDNQKQMPIRILAPKNLPGQQQQQQQQILPSIQIQPSQVQTGAISIPIGGGVTQQYPPKISIQMGPPQNTQQDYETRNINQSYKINLANVTTTATVPAQTGKTVISLGNIGHQFNQQSFQQSVSSVSQMDQSINSTQQPTIYQQFMQPEQLTANKQPSEIGQMIQDQSNLTKINDQALQIQQKDIEMQDTNGHQLPAFELQNQHQTYQTFLQNQSEQTVIPQIQQQPPINQQSSIQDNFIQEQNALIQQNQYQNQTTEIQPSSLIEYPQQQNQYLQQQQQQQFQTIQQSDYSHYQQQQQQLPVQNYQQSVAHSSSIKIGGGEPVKISLGGQSGFSGITSTKYNESFNTSASRDYIDTSFNQPKKQKSSKPSSNTQGVKEEKKKDKKASKKSTGVSKFANSGYADEDFETYKPKTVNSRRRQQSGQEALNKLFETIIDALITKDRSKIFHQQVKKKDAPNYYDLIKQPIALMDMKAKAKREDYLNRQMFLEDLELMRTNAEAYNGIASAISELARDLENHTLELIAKEENCIADYELLIMEQQELASMKLV